MQHVDDRCEPLEQFDTTFLNSSNARACSWNISRIKSELSPIDPAGEWVVAEIIPICFVYFAKVALKSASKLEEVEGVIDIEDMG
jgi:hypothetical protein